MSEVSTHKERTRQRILNEAAAVMRIVGTEGIGVAALMKRAGLTHGGFYAHFSSRDDLVTNGVDRMFNETRERLQALSPLPDGAERLSRLIDLYLSTEARNAPELNCPLPSLSGEACRLPEEARARFSVGIEDMHRVIAGSLEAMGHEQPQALASSAQAELIGAMALARAVPDDAHAERILADSRSQLKQRLGLVPAARS
ncbi:TetR family transcriptional regulator [Erwinia typographi]|uniref:TetR family transcriptional regulator n=1 Tax=Erwinia typographi TaxID=371042 RepID=A0A0A3Z824_9GAMM|nr:TetR/AcrR family transcriptional regulator [Erwinia typographi]KGT95242.1 TetR family transcriptional regulator [Erwinia typographi]